MPETYLEYRNRIEEATARRLRESSELLKILHELSERDDIHTVPADDPIGGRFGYSIWGENFSALPTIQVFNEAKEVIVSDRKEFDRIFEEAYKADYLIDPCDNPVKRRPGFIVTTRISRTYYWMTLENFQKIQTKKESA